MMQIVLLKILKQLHHVLNMPSNNPPRVIVGLSGGVDSSVAALLLKQQGYEVQGLFMKNWEEDDTESYCSASIDVADAQAVCDHLDIPLHTVNFSAEYWDKVFEYFLQEYRVGRTPNPDILCNKEIKFKAFLDYALQLGADFIATGHYVRKQICDGKYVLLKALDDNKDQSYFLYTLGQQQLAHSLFPVGELKKNAVRKIAAEAGFSNHAKKDSTGICFIGERKFKEFLQRYIPAQPGIIKTAEGEDIGRHEGLMYYTLGQRQGLGIGGRRGASEEPWYVIDKDLAHNILVVAQGHQHPKLFAGTLVCGQVSWTIGGKPKLPLNCAAKIRYRQQEQACVVSQFADDRYVVKFQQAQWAITPGQSVVFYLKDVCLGGGVINEYF
jgi:tRNA-specific 2-thiouridylase